MLLTRNIGRMFFAFVLLVSLLTGSAVAKTTVKISFWGEAEQIKLWNDVLAGFQQKHPDIQLDAIPGPWAGYHDKLLVQLVSGTAPDVIVVSPAFFPSFAKNNVFLDLTDRVKKELPLSDFFPSALLRFGDRILGLPIYYDTFMMYYNADLFQEAGVAPPTDSWNWNKEFLAAAQKLTKHDSQGRVTQLGSFPYGNGVNMGGGVYGVWGALRSAGANLFDPIAKEPLINTPAGIEVLRFFQELSSVYKAAAYPGMVSARELSWTNGNVAMISLWGTSVGYYAKMNLPFEWHAMIPPGWNGNKVIEAHSSAITINARTKVADEAWSLVKYLGSELEPFIAAKGSWGPPGRKSFADDYVLAMNKVLPGRDRDLRTVLRAFQWGETFPWSEYWPKLEPIYNTYMDSLWKNEKDAATVAKLMADGFRAAFK